MPKATDAEFVAAAHTAEQFPRLGLPEIALIGRSNVGKSSFLNALVGGRRIARIGRTPGRTRSVNYYRIQKAAFVDLPGYGYARVSKEERERWKSVIESYLARSQVKLAVMIVDVRTGATPLDQTMAEWLRHRNLPTLAVVTKTDKVGRGAVKAAAARVAETLELDATRVVPFSAVKRVGTKEVWTAIGTILEDVAGGASGGSTAPTSSSR